MTDGKNAVGLTGFPTPNTAAGIAGYLLLLFEDREWAQWILGALEPLANAYNFYESGDLSPDEAAEAFRLIIQDAPYNLRTCPNPAGGKIFRINSNGKVQEYNDAGEWQDPTGDATIPPVPEREGGTPPDQICLASENAAHVLELLYENLTDSFNNGLDEAEAATAFTLSTVALIGSEFAPITFALVTFFAIVFSVLYGVLEFVGADLWDEDFTSALVCLLRNCATNVDGVVTFDWDCFQGALARQTNVFDLTFEQLRLFGQIEYMLSVIGGVDALNAAGATTAITDADCECGWCHTWDFNEVDGDWQERFVGACDWGAQWLEGQGWVNVETISLNIEFQIADDTTITRMEFHTDTSYSGVAVAAYENADFTGTVYFRVNATDSGNISVDVPAGAYLAVIVQNTGGTCEDHPSLNIDSLTIHGTGTSPFGLDNC